MKSRNIFQDFCFKKQRYVAVAEGETCSYILDGLVLTIKSFLPYNLGSGGGSHMHRSFLKSWILILIIAIIKHTSSGCTFDITWKCSAGKIAGRYKVIFSFMWAAQHLRVLLHLPEDNIPNYHAHQNSVNTTSWTESETTKSREIQVK